MVKKEGGIDNYIQYMEKKGPRKSVRKATAGD